MPLGNFLNCYSILVKNDLGDVILQTGKASKLSAISYKLLHSFFCNGNISAPWVKFVKDILDNCGLSNVWTIQNVNFNTEWVIAFVKLRLRDHFLQEWNSNLENSPKALNYRHYKQIFEPLQKKLCKSL
jgi:hypothetical protein